MSCLAIACTDTIESFITSITRHTVLAQYQLQFVFGCVVLQRPLEPVLPHNLHAVHRHSFFRHIHYSSHYAWVDFTIVQNGAPLTSSAAIDVLDDLQSTRFGWIRTVVCSRLSCSGLGGIGLLGVALAGIAFSGPTLFCLSSFFIRWA